jgi:hypothetical protein
MFCILEKNDKTFEYTTKFIAYIRQNKLDKIVVLENDLQKGEIKNHLCTNSFPEDDRAEMINWIHKYAGGFRYYLNTLKIAAMMWCYAKAGEELTWADYCGLADWINSTQPCLDAIHE